MEPRFFKGFLKQTFTRFLIGVWTRLSRSLKFSLSLSNCLVSSPALSSLSVPVPPPRSLGLCPPPICLPLPLPLAPLLFLSICLFWRSMLTLDLLSYTKCTQSPLRLVMLSHSCASLQGRNPSSDSDEDLALKKKDPLQFTARRRAVATKKTRGLFDARKIKHRNASW